MSERLVSILAEKREKLLNCGFRGHLTTPGGSVNVYSDVNETDKVLKSLTRDLNGLVPGLSVEELPDQKAASLFLSEDRNRSIIFDNNFNTAILSGSENDFKDGQALLWSSYWLMEAQRQDKSMFTLHSSALEIDGKGIILFGHSGAGKTTVMLDLCRKYEGSVISNDLTIIKHNTSSQEMEVVDGTKDLRLRLSSVSRNFPDLGILFQGTNGSAWEDKIAVNPEQMGLKSFKKPSKLDSIFEIHLDSKEQDPLIIEKATGIPFLYRLYEDMSRIVRGSAISIFSEDADFLGYLPSLDDEEKHKKRVDCINHMTKVHGIVSVSGGNLDQVSEAIYKQLR